MAKGEALKKEMKFSKELQAVLKKKKLPRGKISKYLWKYIKKHELQSSKDGRIVKCDDKLKAVFKKIIKKDRKLKMRGKTIKIPAGRIFLTEIMTGLKPHLS